MQSHDVRVARNLISDEKEKEGQGQIKITERLFSHDEAAGITKELFAAKDPVFKPERGKRGGREYVLKRETAFFGAKGASYSYGGIRKLARRWGKGTMGRIVNRIRAKVTEKTGQRPKIVVGNFYSDGDTAIGLHSDDERDLDPTAPIVSVSFGATRDMVFKHKKGEMNDIKIALPSGSMIEMHPPCQSIWKHSIPVRKTVTTGRFNFTFRVLKGSSAGQE